MPVPGVVFLSVGNAARSQIAEGLARQRFGDRLRILSAGTAPATVHPLAVEVMTKVGVDLTTHHAKPVADIDPAGIELVITLCADEVCPAVLAPVRRLHWPLAAPAITPPGDAGSLLGPDAMARHRFRVARLQLAARLDLLEPALALPPRTQITPAVAGDRAELERLLTAAALPLDGLDDCFPHDVVVARCDDLLIGAAGLERWSAFGLVRSVVVAEGYRGKHIAEALITERLCVARLDALHAVYLLTSDAAGYFERFGFAPVDRAGLPPPIAASSRLLPVCTRAAVMVKQLAAPSSTDALLEDAIVLELAAHGTLVPPWVKHPELPRRSLGWRMGAGEWYLWMWRRWWDRVAPPERAAYVATWTAGLPAAWRGWW